ncbi:Uncharacterised protein [Fluoribacter dumoffii]|uniref:Uncharacterized protein n=1 Tax=Fluoribacter dumoffii TaxID=463 RepID=A0A377GAL6_9GAMM|nr:Uncharacterised protein [Fluoribacter dumoffii]
MFLSWNLKDMVRVKIYQELIFIILYEAID